MRLTAEGAWRFWREELGTPRYVLAPMVNASELQFRLLCGRYGVELAYTPMLHSRLISSEKDYRGKFHPAVVELPKLPKRDPAGHFTPGESEERYTEPKTIAQICGHEPSVVVTGCKKIENTVKAIDLNCGCPQGIARRGLYGSFLLQQPETILAVVKAMVDELACPVTVKIRIADAIDSADAMGLNEHHESAPGAIASRREDVVTACEKTYKLVADLEALGVAAICLHGRTSKNKGHDIQACDWAVIREVVNRAKIPIIANGSVETRADADACLEYTGAAAVMSAEGLLNNPAMFSTEPHPSQAELMRELCYIYEHTRVDAPVFSAPLKPHVFHATHARIQRAPVIRQRLVEARTIREISDVCSVLAALCADAPAGPSYYRRHWKGAKVLVGEPGAENLEPSRASKKLRLNEETTESAAH